MTKTDIKTTSILTMDGILDKCRELNKATGSHCAAVPAAHDAAVIDAVVEAKKNNISDAILFGKAEEIERLLQKVDANLSFDIVDTVDDTESADRAAQAVSDGKADIIMKGMLSTGTLLKSILKKEHGLRGDRLLSHTAVLSPKRYHKLLAITDGGMVAKPTFEQKIQIVQNALTVSRALGVKIPKVAILSAADWVVPGQTAHLEAAAISKMAERSQIPSCMIDGPMSLDTAIWDTALPKVLQDNPVAGDADIILTNSIEEGNILAKSLIMFGGASFAGVILGAKVPVSLVSRADSAFNKMISVALAVIVSAYMKGEVE